MSKLRMCSIRLAFSAVLSATLLSLVGCSSDVVRRWSEDVALDGGKSIVVDRYVKFWESNALGGGAYGSREIKSTLEFRGAMASLPTWNETLIPLLLYSDQATQEWVIVATTSSCEVWQQRGSPAPPYWEFRSKDGKWVSVPLSESSIGRTTNLYFDYLKPLPARHLSVAMKSQIIAQSYFNKKYLRVDGKTKTRCM